MMLQCLMPKERSRRRDDEDTVIVAEETYTGNIRFNGEKIIFRSTNPLNPDVAPDTIIDGNRSGSAVAFSSAEHETCALSGFRIRNGPEQHHRPQLRDRRMG